MAGKGEMTMFGKYLLLRKLDTGGMGEIWLAKQGGAAGFEKYVVVKRVLSQHLDNEDFIQMFLQEAKTTSTFNHANIVQVYDFGELEGSYFTAMEYIHGKGLDAIIERCKKQHRKVHPAHIVEIISGVCAGLSYVHNLNDPSTLEPLHIIHRDVNPQNIMINYNGEVKVIDFGIAKSEMNENKTETGTLKGKFVYMSPEQSRAAKLDKRSDIFPIGICLYQLCNYENPFAKPNIVLSLEAIQKEDPPPLATIDEKYACFDPILKKALAKDPNDRYADCRDMQNDMQRLLISGAVEPAEQTLADFMAELYAESLAKDRERMKEYASVRVPEKSNESPSSGNIPVGQYQNDYQQGYQQGSSSGNIPLQNNLNVSGVYNQGQMNAMGQQAWMNNGYQPMMGVNNMPGVPYGMQDPNTQMMYGTMGMQYPPQQSSKGGKIGLAIGISLGILALGGGGGYFLIAQKAKPKAVASGITALQPVQTGGIAQVQPTNNEETKFAKPSVAPQNEEKAPAVKETPKVETKEAAKPVAQVEEKKPVPAPTPKEEPKTVIIKREEPKPAPKPAPAPKAAPATKPVPAPAPAPKEEPAIATGPVGDIMVASPGAQITINGKNAGSPAKADNISAKGTIHVSSSQTFEVNLKYTVADDKMTYSVTTEPKGLMVNLGGVARGKSPVSIKSKGGSDKFEFVDPSSNETMKIIIKFTAK